MFWFVGVDDWLASYGTEQRKIELDPISTEERLLQLFAVYGCNGTEFSYVIFTEQRNFTTAERRNGPKRQRKNSNGMVETRHYSCLFGDLNYLGQATTSGHVCVTCHVT